MGHRAGTHPTARPTNNPGCPRTSRSRDIETRGTPRLHAADQSTKGSEPSRIELLNLSPALPPYGRPLLRRTEEKAAVRTLARMFQELLSQARGAFNDSAPAGW